MTGPSSGDRPAPDLMEALKRSLTRPSSGDRPAEETCGSCAHPAKAHNLGSGWSPTFCLQDDCTCPRFSFATPPAVRTGDEKAGHVRTACPICASPAIERAEHPDHRWCSEHGCYAALSTPPPVSGTDRAVHLGQAGALAMLAEELERAGEMRAADLADRTAKFYRQWADDPAVVPPYVEDLPHRDDQPVSGTATRDDVRRELARHSASARVVGNGSTYITCRCGHAIGSYFHGWGDPASHEAWELHRADALLALGGSQPATQPAQHHDDDRPITQYTEQGDEGLRGRVEALAEQVQRDADRAYAASDEATAAPAYNFAFRLRRALDDGGDRG